MISFVDWLETHPFFITEGWDFEKERMSGVGQLKLFPHQKEILKYCLTIDPSKDRFPYTTALFSCPKKSGKTTIAAAVMAWYADAGPDHSEIYSMANTREQARARAYTDLCYHIGQAGGVAFKDRIDFSNGSFVQALPKEYRNIAGARPAVTVFDELWGYSNEDDFRIWTEMTPPPTVRFPLRFIVTYAGFYGESKLLYDIYERCVLKGIEVPELAHIQDDRGDPVCFTDKDRTTFVYWDTISRMPWQTPEYYNEQFANLPGNEFLRVHRNQWVTSREEFIPITMWDQAVENGKNYNLTGPLTLLANHPARTYPISVAVDAGIKHDCTAVVGCYYDPVRGRVGVAFHKIWQPTKDDPIDLETTVEQYVLELNRHFRIVSVVYDPTQLHRSMTTLKREGLPTIEFSQHQKMIAATEHLYELFKSNALEAYPSDEIRDHIKYAMVENKGGGHIKLVRGKNIRYKIDAAVTLAMAAYDAVNRGGVDTRKKTVIESPYSDWTARPQPQILDYKNLPEPLRPKPTWKVWSI